MAEKKEFSPLTYSQVVGILKDVGYKQTEVKDSTGGITTYAP